MMRLKIKMKVLLHFISQLKLYCLISPVPAARSSGQSVPIISQSFEPPAVSIQPSLIQDSEVVIIWRMKSTVRPLVPWFNKRGLVFTFNLYLILLSASP